MLSNKFPPPPPPPFHFIILLGLIQNSKYLALTGNVVVDDHDVRHGAAVGVRQVAVPALSGKKDTNLYEIIFNICQKSRFDF